VQQIIRAYEEYDVVHPQRGGNTVMARRERSQENPGKEREKEHSKDDCEPPAGGAPGAGPHSKRFAPRETRTGLEEAGLTVRLVSDAEIARMMRLFGRRKGDDVLPSLMARRKTVRLRRGLADGKGRRISGDIAISPGDGAALREKKRTKTFQ